MEPRVWARASAAASSAPAQIWRLGLRLALLVTSALHAVSAELLRRACGASRRRRGGGTSDALPFFSLSASSSAAFTRKNSAIDFLEKFRQGPETHSEWNLLLWRVTFPLVTLVLCTFLAVAGKVLGLAVYSLLVCPVWYFCNFCLGAYPFLLVFRFPELDETAQWRLWQSLAGVSVAISAVEWYMSAPKSRYSWILGNTLFGIVAIAAVPMFFRIHRRVARSHYDALLQADEDQGKEFDDDDDDDDEQQNSQDDANSSSLWSDGVFSSRSAGGSRRYTPDSDTDTVERVMLHQMDVYSPRSTTTVASRRFTDASTGSGIENDADEGMLNDTLSPSASRRPRRRLSPEWNSPSSTAGSINSTQGSETSRSLESSRLVYVCGACAAVVWLVMFTTYSAGDPGSQLWFLLYAMSPVLCIALFCSRDRRKSTSFSFEHLVLYGVLIVHVPIFLGHFCVRLFAMAEASGETGDGANAGGTASASWLQLGVSIVYLLLMQGYFFMLTHVVNRMSEPFAHPSLLYIGQLYYYIFWYILVGSDTPIDALYWGMLLVSNVHIALLNTGVYTDFKQSSTGWLSSLSHLTSPLALCLRTNPSSIPRARCLRMNRDDDGAELYPVEQRPPIDGVDGDYEDGGSLASAPASRLRVGGGAWTETSSHRPWRSMARSDDASYLSPDVDTHAGGKPRSQSVATSTTSLLSRPCSNVRRSMGATASADSSSSGCCQKGDYKSKSSEAIGSGAPSLSSSTLASSQARLRPLYFLMKVAEQDNMADTTALILVPTLLTLLAVFDKPSHGFLVLQEQWNMWLRCVCMFIGRLGGSYLAREIFACKLKSRLRSASSAADELPETIDGLSARLWIQRLMLQDFHGQFWYLTAVTLIVTFACFDRVDLPLRFALLS